MPPRPFKRGQEQVPASRLTSIGGSPPKPQPFKETPLNIRDMTTGNGSASFRNNSDSPSRAGSASSSRVPTATLDTQMRSTNFGGEGGRLVVIERSEGASSYVFDDLLRQSERALQKNQLRAADQLRSLKRVMNHAETLVNDLDAGFNPKDRGPIEGSGEGERSQAVDEIISAMLKRRGTYAEVQSKSDGVLSLGPPLKSLNDEERVKECFFALARTIPTGTSALDQLASELLTASTAEGIEVVYKYVFKSLADTYGSAQELTSAFGQSADSFAKGTRDDDGDESDDASRGKGSFMSSLAAQNNFVTSTRKMKNTVNELRKALATMALCSSAGLDMCVDLRNKLEVNEASLKNVTKNSVLLSRHARQLQIENESLRAQVFMSGTSQEEQEVNATNIIERITSKGEVPRAIVMVQIENTQTLKLMKPTVISEALLQVHQWVDIKLGQYKGVRVNYSSANEPRDMFDSEKNPYFAPESYAFEFPSIGPAIEFCVCMQHELLYTMDWSPKLLRIRDFKEIKDSANAAPAGETPSQRKKRLANAEPLWRGLRVRMAIHVGIPHILRPFRKDIVEEARRRQTMKLATPGVIPKGPVAEVEEKSEQKGKGKGETALSVEAEEGEAKAEAEETHAKSSKAHTPRPGDDGLLPDNAPHLAGAAMELTMLILRRARGGEILLSPKANEAYDDLKFMYPDALANVYKEERDYSGMKGANTTASDVWMTEEEKVKEKANAVTKQGGRGTLTDDKAFLRATDRLWAVVSDILKNREKPRPPFCYNKTFEVVFPPTSFWRMTDAAQQNLSLFASSASRVEALLDDEEDDEITDDSEDEYIPAKRMAAPELRQIQKLPSRKSVAQGASASDVDTGGGGVAGGDLSPTTMALVDPSSALTGQDLLSLTLRGGGGGGLSGAPAAPEKRAKRKTTAEYEELLAHSTARNDALLRRLKQLEEMNALYANEVQSSREQTNRMTEKTRVADSVLDAQKRVRSIYQQQLARVNNNAMQLADTLSGHIDANAVLLEKNAKLTADVKRLEAVINTMRKEQDDRDQRHLTNKSVGLMTGPDIQLVNAQERSAALEAALRGVGSVLGAWVQHLENVMRPPSREGTSAMTSPRTFHPSHITGDLHTRMSEILQNEAIGKIIATSADRVQPAASLRSAPAATSQLKSTKWDDLVRLSRQTLQQAMSAATGERNPEEPVDISAAMKELSMFECVRNICGFMAKGIKSVLEYENLMQIRFGKLNAALTNANNAVEASLGNTLSGSLSEDAITTIQETAADPASQSLASTVAGAGDGGGGGAQMMYNPVHLQRLREAERKLKEQETLIAQVKAESIKASADHLIDEKEIELANLRLTAMRNKATELALALRNMRETVGLVLERLLSESASASLIKLKCMKATVPAPDGSEGAPPTPVKDMSDDGSFSTDSLGALSPAATNSETNEFLLSKIFGDIQQLLMATCTDFCSNNNTNNVSSKNLKDSASSAPKRGAFYSEGGAFSTMAPQAKAKALRTGVGVTSHESEIQSILAKSTLSAAKDPLAGETQLKLDQLADDIARVSKLIGPQEQRAKVMAEKEASRKQRDTAFESDSWAAVVEKTYNKERYLGDQVRYLKKRVAQIEIDQQAGIERLVEAEVQTTLQVSHRVFQKLDAATAAGVDIDFEERERAKKDKQEEVSRLLVKMRQVEGESQTDELPAESHWTQTDPRTTGLPPPPVAADTPQPAAKEPPSSAKAEPSTREHTEVIRPELTDKSTMTDSERTDLPMIATVSRSVATMTDEEETMLSTLVSTRQSIRMSLAPSFSAASASAGATSNAGPAKSKTEARSNSVVRWESDVKSTPLASSAAPTQQSSVADQRQSISSAFPNEEEEGADAFQSPHGVGGEDGLSASRLPTLEVGGPFRASADAAATKKKSLTSGAGVKTASVSKAAPTNAAEGGASSAARSSVSEQGSKRGGFNSSTKMTVSSNDKISQLGPSAAPEKAKPITRAASSVKQAVGGKTAAVRRGHSTQPAKPLHRTELSSPPSSSTATATAPAPKETRKSVVGQPDQIENHPAPDAGTADVPSFESEEESNADINADEAAVTSHDPTPSRNGSEADTIEPPKGVEVSAPQQPTQSSVPSQIQAPASSETARQSVGSGDRVYQLKERPPPKAPPPPPQPMLFQTGRPALQTAENEQQRVEDESIDFATEKDGDDIPTQVTDAQEAPWRVDASVIDNLKMVDLHGDRPRSGLPSRASSAQNRSSATDLEGSRGLQALMQLKKGGDVSPAEEIFSPIPAFGTAGARVAGGASVSSRPPSGASLKTMLNRPYGITKKLGGAQDDGTPLARLRERQSSAAKEAEAQRQAEVVQKRVHEETIRTLISSHTMFVKNGGDVMGGAVLEGRSVKAERDSALLEEEAQAVNQSQLDGADVDAAGRGATVTSLLIRSRVNASRPNTSESHQEGHRQGVAYSLEPPLEMAGQYDMHRRFYERPSLFGEAASQMQGLGADAYDRLLLRPAVRPSESTLDAAGAHELAILREASRVATADKIRVATAHARQREKALRDIQTASAASKAPAAVAMQHVLQRPITTPSPSRRSNVGGMSVLSAINHSATAPSPTPGAAFPFVGGNGASFMLPPVEPSPLPLVTDPATSLPVISKNEHGRPSSPVRVPKAEPADAGDKLLIHQAQHSKVSLRNANNSNLNTSAPLPTLTGQSKEREGLAARSYTPLGRMSASQQRNPMLSIKPKR